MARHRGIAAVEKADLRIRGFADRRKQCLNLIRMLTERRIQFAAVDAEAAIALGGNADIHQGANIAGHAGYLGSDMTAHAVDEVAQGGIAHQNAGLFLAGLAEIVELADHAVEILDQTLDGGFQGIAVFLDLDADRSAVGLLFQGQAQALDHVVEGVAARGHGQAVDGQQGVLARLGLDQVGGAGVVGQVGQTQVIDIGTVAVAYGDFHCRGLAAAVGGEREPVTAAIVDDGGAEAEFILIDVVAQTRKGIVAAVDGQRLGGLVRIDGKAAETGAGDCAKTNRQRTRADLLVDIGITAAGQRVLLGQVLHIEAVVARRCLVADRGFDGIGVRVAQRPGGEAVGIAQAGQAGAEVGYRAAHQADAGEFGGERGFAPVEAVLEGATLGGEQTGDQVAQVESGTYAE